MHFTAYNGLAGCDTLGPFFMKNGDAGPEAEPVMIFFNESNPHILELFDQPKVKIF